MIIVIIYFGYRYRVFKPEIPVKSCIGNEKVLIHPLTKDHNNMYKTEIVLGFPKKDQKNSGGENWERAKIEVVPDTGSNILLVNSTKCQGCDINDGNWNPEHGEKVSFLAREIRYAGGQKSTYNLWKAYLMNYGPDREKEISFGVVSNLSSKFNPENVMGLQPNSGFLSQLCGPKMILFDFPKSKLVIGDINSYQDENLKRENSKGKPTKTSQTSKTTFDIEISPINFVNYIQSKLENIYSTKILPDGSQKKERIYIPNLNKYKVVIDTGTSSTIIPPSLFSKIKSNYITLDFVNQINNSQDENGSTSEITFPMKNVHEGTIINNKTILIGHSWLHPYSVGFDFENNKITMK